MIALLLHTFLPPTHIVSFVSQSTSVVLMAMQGGDVLGEHTFLLCLPNYITDSVVRVCVCVCGSRPGGGGGGGGVGGARCTLHWLIASRVSLCTHYYSIRSLLHAVYTTGSRQRRQCGWLPSRRDPMGKSLHGGFEQISDYILCHGYYLCI